MCFDVKNNFHCDSLDTKIVPPSDLLFYPFPFHKCSHFFFNPPQTNWHLHEPNFPKIYMIRSKSVVSASISSLISLQVRDMAVEALSDGAFVAPMARLAEVVSRKAETYMYVFAHHDRDHQVKQKLFQHSYFRQSRAFGVIE